MCVCVSDEVILKVVDVRSAALSGVLRLVVGGFFVCGGCVDNFSL